jgi:hypothetical protein
MKLIFAALLVLIPALASLTACSSPPAGEVAGIHSVRAAVTRDFGAEVLADRPLGLPENSNALEGLGKVAKVETSYGGGFVKSINGLSSRYGGPASSKQDWFLFINGMISNTGGRDYRLLEGDLEQWDYHTWSLHQKVPAIIGHFPRPFSGGYAGKTRATSIVFESGLEKEASGMNAYLQSSGVMALDLTAIDALAEKDRQERNLLLLALPDNSLVRELNRNWRRLGFYAYFENAEIVALNAEGKTTQRYGSGTGLIQATQNPWNPDGIGADENVVWLISGTDPAGLQSAVDVLVNQSESLTYACSIIVSGGNIIRLPQ